MDEHIKQTLRLGREHYEKGEFDKAERLLSQVIDAEDRLADVHDMLGVIRHRTGDLVEAERHFERALELNPAYTEAALNLAVTYNDRGKYEASRQLLSKMPGQRRAGSPALDPFARGKLANMHAELGNAYADAGIVEEAISEYRKAVALCPEFADLHTRLGSLLRNMNKLTEAREHFERAVLARPSYIPARLQLGVTMLAQGEPESAEREWQKVLEMDPENGRARMYLRIAHKAGASR